jgi:polyferredoxin
MFDLVHDDVLFNVFQHLSNIQTMHALASTCKSTSRCWKSIQPSLLCKHSFPKVGPKDQASKENLSHQAHVRSTGGTICMLCRWCMDIYPIDVETMMIAHTCDSLLTPLNMSTHRNNVLWRGPTSHMKKPPQSPQMVLYMHGYIKSPVYDEITGRTF